MKAQLPNQTVFEALAMTRFARQFAGKNFIPMHNTNPQAFSQKELEHTLGVSLAEILTHLDLGFNADEGSYDLRQIIATTLYDKLKASDVLTFAGAQEALFCAFHALLQAKDTVLVVLPIFEPLLKIPQSIGCNVCRLALDFGDNWSLDIDKIEAVFKQGCKLFVINFPHNPTGATISRTKLKQIVELCEKYGVWLLSDEVFRGLEHSPDKQLPAVADLYPKGISVGVISKAYGIGGLRVGWLLCQHTKLLKRLLEIKSYLSICSSQVDEYLVAEIVKKHDKIYDRNIKIINNNKKLLNNFKVIYKNKINFFIPQAGCCVFAQITDGMRAIELVKLVLKRSNFLLYPADLFFCQNNAIRIGFGTQQFVKFINEVNP